MVRSLEDNEKEKEKISELRLWIGGIIKILSINLLQICNGGVLIIVKWRLKPYFWKHICPTTCLSTYCLTCFCWKHPVLIPYTTFIKIFLKYPPSYHKEIKKKYIISFLIFSSNLLKQKKYIYIYQDAGENLKLSIQPT